MNEERKAELRKLIKRNMAKIRGNVIGGTDEAVRVRNETLCAIAQLSELEARSEKPSDMLTGADMLAIGQAMHERFERTAAQDYAAKLANLITRFPRSVRYWGIWNK